MTYETVIFDFNGVLCHDHFYSNPHYRRLDEQYHGIYDFIQTHIFQDEDRVNAWMRNQLTTDDVNRFIAAQTAIDFDTLSDILRESVIRMRVDQRLIDRVLALKQSGVLVALVTDNMDVFSQTTIQNHQLDSIFDVIVNSADYGILKGDDHGKLFDIAHNQLRSQAGYQASLLIDDSAQARLIYEKKGGHTYPYTSFREFTNWMEQNL